MGKPELLNGVIQDVKLKVIFLYIHCSIDLIVVFWPFCQPCCNCRNYFAL